MKDRLKFRAWDKQYKKMIRINRMDFDTEEIDYDGNLNEPKNWEHFNIMQFTGQRDKNGKEIFEGDLLQYFNEINKVIWNSKEGSFGRIPLRRYSKQTERIYGSDSAIIGNIYENSDIMEV